MDVAKMLSDLGKAAEVIQKPLSLEDAVNIVDPEMCNSPEVMAKLPDSMAAVNALSYKARKMVADYVREKLAEEKKDD